MRCQHKCIQVSKEGFLGSMYTKTGKVLTTAAAALCLFLEKNTRRHKALEFWGEGKEWSLLKLRILRGT